MIGRYGRCDRSDVTMDPDMPERCIACASDYRRHAPAQKRLRTIRFKRAQAPMFESVDSPEATHWVETIERQRASFFVPSAVKKPKPRGPRKAPIQW